MGYSVEFENRVFDAVEIDNLSFTPVRFSTHAIGGPEYAEVKVTGTLENIWQLLDFLRFHTLIRNNNANVIWNGYISEVQLNLGGLTVSKNIDELKNRVKVFYTYKDASGNSVDTNTSWYENTESMSKYGYFDHIESSSDLSTNEAVKLAEEILDTYKEPLSNVVFNNSSVSAMLICRGWWSSLNWRIYNNLGGFESYPESGDYNHTLGYSFVGTDVAFNASTDRIHTLSDKLSHFTDNDFIVVSGSASNDGTYQVITPTTNEIETITKTTISFDASDDILDSGNNLGFIKSNELLLVSGSVVGGNNRYYFSKDDLEDEHITVTPGTVTASAAGSSITITQGHSIELDGALVTEFPSASITVTSLGVKVAQSFTLSVNETFVLTEAYIRLLKIGSPADSVQLSIYSDSGGVPNTQLATNTISAASIGEGYDWKQFTFSYTLSYGTTYWLVIERTGSNSAVNFYQVELNTAADYANGAFKLWNGSSWVARPTTTEISAVEMPFQLWSNIETSTQMETILDYANQAFSTFEVIEDSGVSKRPFRDNNNTAREEIEAMMRVKNTNGKRYISTVTPDRACKIYQEPTSDITLDMILNIDGNVLDASGELLEEGKTPVGNYVWLAGLPVGLDSFSPVFVERAEIDCAYNKLSALEFKGITSPWKEII